VSCCVVTWTCVSQEFEKLSEFVEKHYHTTLSKRDMSLRGWNWGTADFVGKFLPRSE